MMMSPPQSPGLPLPHGLREVITIGRSAVPTRQDLRAAHDEERRLREPLDARPRVDGEGRAVGHVHEAAQGVHRVGVEAACSR
jgi:hypothetical protein